MLKIKEITIPLYNVNIKLVLGDFKESVDYIENIEGRLLEYPDFADACCYSFEDKIYILIQPEHIDIALLIHEIAHATFDVMNLIGLLISDQEAFCYIQQYIVSAVLCTLSIPTDHSNLQLELEDMPQ